MHTPDFKATQAPLARIDGRMVYDIGSPDQESVWTRWETDRLAEGLRLAYVAMTRARERLYVAWGAASGAGAAPLGYLLAGHTAPLDDDDLDAHVAAARGRGGSAATKPLDTLRALAERYPDQMTVEPLPDAPPGRLAAPAPERQAHGLAARTVSPEARARVLAPWRAVSFSAWAATQAGAAPRAGADEPDHRARADAPAAGIHAFAAGRVAGTCLHEILQGATFAHPPGDDDPPADPDATNPDAADPARDAAARSLAAHGLADPRRHRAPIDPLDEAMALVARVATAPLPGAGFCLADTAPAARAAEWRFVAPVARVAPADLAAVFRAHAAPEHRDAYADALADLSPDAADGFLTGIADLVVCHDDRWSVIDWKSNHLGPTAEAYTPEALDEAMAAHHYVLQACLYLVGLHRTLGARLPGYDYDLHVAGAFYVFLRGLRPGASDGIVALRPPRALVEALDALLSTGS
jgi:exodeoxyribonuclease V beta subunit